MAGQCHGPRPNPGVFIALVVTSVRSRKYDYIHGIAATVTTTRFSNKVMTVKIDFVESGDFSNYDITP